MNEIFAVQKSDKKWVGFDCDTEYPVYHFGLSEAVFFSCLDDARDFCNTWELDSDSYKIIEIVPCFQGSWPVATDIFNHD